MRKQVQLTEHFTLADFTRSPKAESSSIDNTPPDSLLNNIEFTASKLEIVRIFLGHRPIMVTSGYRCPQLNRIIGGSINSQHMNGEAVDFICPSFGTPKEIAKCLQPLVKVIGIDQLILENTWVHCSFTNSPRHEVLTLVGRGYAIGLV